MVLKCTIIRLMNIWWCMGKKVINDVVGGVTSVATLGTVKYDDGKFKGTQFGEEVLNIGTQLSTAGTVGYDDGSFGAGESVKLGTQVVGGVISKTGEALQENPVLGNVAEQYLGFNPTSLLDRKENGQPGSNPTIITTSPAAAPVQAGSNNQNMPLIMMGGLALIVMIFFLTKKR